MLRTFILAVSAMALSAPALAQPYDDPQEPPYAVVEYGDLNLKDQHDANRLVDRIQAASDNVCNTRDGRVGLDQRARNQNCTHVAERRAVADVGNANVFAGYYGYRPDITIEDDYPVTDKD